MPGQYSLGTASGAVVIDYKSKGAGRVSTELDQFKQSTRAVQSSLGTLATQFGVGGRELDRYTRIQSAAKAATEVYSRSYSTLIQMQKSGVATMKQVAAQEAIVTKSRRSLVDITNVLNKAQGQLPQSMAGAGTKAAQQFGQEFQNEAGNAFAGAALGSKLVKGAKFGVFAAAAITAGAAIKGVSSILSGGFNRLANLDNARFKLAAIGASAAETQTILDEVDESVTDTTFALDEMAGVAAQAFAAGIPSGKDMQSYLNAVADTAAIAQANLSDIGFVFSQIKTEGHAYTRRLNQIAIHGIPIWQTLAESIGVTQAEIHEMAENGEIDINMVVDAINNKFGGAAKTMGGAVRAAISNVKIAFSRLGATLLEPIFAGQETEASLFAKALQKVKEAVNSVNKFFKSHKSEIISFWTAIAKAAVFAAQVIAADLARVTAQFGVLIGGLALATKAVSTFLHMLSMLADQGILKLIPGYKDFVSGLEAGSITSDVASTKMIQLSKDALKLTKNIWDTGMSFKEGYKWIDEWSEKLREGKLATDENSKSQEEGGKAAITIADALEKLEVSFDQAQSAISGTDDEFQKFLDKIKDDAPKELIDTLKILRYQFEHGGRQAAELDDALESLGDSTVSASDKASKLIDALKRMGTIGAQDEIADFNQTLDDLVDYENELLDPLGKFGDALVKNGDELDLNTENGRRLYKSLGDVRQAMYEVVAAGEMSPTEAWTKAHNDLLLILQDAGIFGDQAQAIIDNYLTDQHTFEVIMSVRDKDDVQESLTSLYLQLESAKKKDLNDIKIHFDGDEDEVKALQEALEAMGIEWRQFDPLTGTVTLAIPEGADLTAIKQTLEQSLNKVPTQVDAVLDIDPDNPEALINQITGGNPLRIPAVLDFETEADRDKRTDQERGTGGILPGNEDIPKRPPVTSLPGFGKQGFMNTDEINQYIDEQTDHVRSQGENFAQSYAEGIRSRISDVIAAALELARAATEPLGSSPAKYGPLSGSGWTFYRGQNVSTAFAAGMSAGAADVGSAGVEVASLATAPIDSMFSRWLKDLGQFSEFAQHLKSFISSLADITFNVLKAAQDISGGKLFPKSYIRDPDTAERRRKRAAREAQRESIAAQTTSGITRPTGNLPTSGLQGRLVSSLRAAGLSDDEIRGIVAMNQVESGGKREGFLGFTNSQAATPQAAIDKFLNEQWRPRTRGGIPGVDQNGNVYDWDRYMTFIRTKIVGQNGVIDWQGNQQPPAAEYQRRLMDALGISTISTVGANGLRNAPAILKDTGRVASEALAQNAAAWVADLFPEITEIGGSRIGNTAKNTHDIGRSIDIAIPAWNTKAGKELGDQINGWLRANADALGIVYTIWQDQWRDFKGNVSTVGGHLNHIDVHFAGPSAISTVRGRGVKLGIGGEAGGRDLNIDAKTIDINHRGTGAEPGPITDAIDRQTDAINRGFPDVITQMASGDSELSRALEIFRNGSASQAETTSVLQHLDGLISDYSKVDTDQGRATVDALQNIRSGIMEREGLQEGPSALDQAQSIASGVQGIVGDAFLIIDGVLKSIASAKEISGTLVRGIANTEDIYNIVDEIQSFIELAQAISQTVTDALGLASTIAGMSAGSDPSGGAQGAAAALGAATAISGIITSAISAANAAIDLGQEAYRIATKYWGRFFTRFLGGAEGPLTGGDIKFLLDTVTGQLKAYTSENPEEKRLFGGTGAERATPTNYFTVYQGPGQDPRDTMSDMMFTVKSSSVGAFGYGGGTLSGF